MSRFVCIHGHFYQPPRDNPWLEAVEVQDSAYPYHDWNQRITAECYAANAAARTLDATGHIVRIGNNYERISFNFGPTLLDWLAGHARETYDAVLAADRESRSRFSGHGNALAQAYNHTILPLASRRDKVTQVRWGLADFNHRFGREAEGMWLPEAAADVETLEVLAETGVRFTVLAPHQAARVRRIGETAWQDVSGGRVDPTRAYRVALPSGRDLGVFFYDGPISRALAFERLLERGEHLAGRLLSAFPPGRDQDRLVNIATDGETYGHHHRFGDMALAWALELLERSDARLTNYGEFFERVPPRWEADIVAPSSWSCAHGVERWRSDCGCQTGGRPGWNQAWRGPLREALDGLRRRLAPGFERLGAELLAAPWAARDDYIGVVLDRSVDTVAGFLARHRRRELSRAEEVTVLRLLEMQRHLMLADTSCGWFFADVGGIETVQVLAYAARALQLAGQLFGADEPLEPAFLAALERAVSNDPELGTARAIYEKQVRPAALDLEGVAAHVAIASLFDGAPRRETVFCYDVERTSSRTREAGRLRLALGRLDVTSRITRERALLSWAVLHFGDHNLTAGVRALGEDEHALLVREATDAFGQSDLPAVIRALDRHFAGLAYSLASLFRDEQRRILDRVLGDTLAEAEAEYVQLFDHHAPLMHFLARLDVPLPKAFSTAAELVVNARLRRAFEASSPDAERVQALLRQAREYQVALDRPGLAFAAVAALERLMAAVAERPGEVDALNRLVGAVGLARTLPFELDLWRLQNRAWELLARRRSLAGPPEWDSSLALLGELLGLRPQDV